MRKLNEYQGFAHDEKRSNPCETLPFTDSFKAQASRNAVVGGELSAMGSVLGWGRLKHESVEPLFGPDGRASANTGVDQRFKYIDKYVSDSAAKDMICSHQQAGKESSGALRLAAACVAVFALT